MMDIDVTFQSAVRLTWIMSVVGLFVLGPLLIRLRYELRDVHHIGMGLILSETLLLATFWSEVTVGTITLIFIRNIHVPFWYIEVVGFGWVLIPWSAAIRLVLWRRHVVAQRKEEEEVLESGKSTKHDDVV